MYTTAQQTRPMERINRLMTNICSDKIVETKTFYTKLFDFDVNFDSDWFVQLRSKEGQFELGIIDRTSELVPKAFQQLPQGFYITFVVTDVDQVFETAKEAAFEIISEPTDTFYGQRRLLLKDPNGTLVDVSAPVAEVKI